LNILLISGSQRDCSKSLAVAQYLKINILEEMTGSGSSILNLADYSFLLDHYGACRDEGQLAKEKDQVLAQLYACDAVIIIAPEWGGMIPPALINLLLLSANGSANGLPLGHKPAFAIGISASGGGSYPISLLKGYSGKNSHLVWLPLHAIIQNVDEFLSEKYSPDLHESNNSRFNQIQSRIQVGIKSLAIYAKQMAPIRAELVALSKVHPFGQ